MAPPHRDRPRASLPRPPRRRTTSTAPSPYAASTRARTARRIHRPGVVPASRAARTTSGGSRLPTDSNLVDDRTPVAGFGNPGDAPAAPRPSATRDRTPTPTPDA